MSETRSPDWPHDQAVDDDPMAGFNDWWDVFPRHQAKRDAQKAWKQIKAGLDPALRARIMQDTTARLWPHEMRYVMLGATYLRGARYDDEPVTADAVPLTPANRWMPSNVEGGRIPDGHLWCKHAPMCTSDLAHIRQTMDDAENEE